MLHRLRHRARHSLRHHAKDEMFGLTHDPARYERHNRFLVGRLYRRVVADVASAGLPAGALVLDIGTGPGRLPIMIAERCPDLSVRGVDLSPEMIRYAADAAVAAGFPPSRVAMQEADAAHLPQQDGSVDLVVSTISLHHWSEPAAGLQEVIRVLRPGGRAWIYDLRRVLRRAEPSARADGVDVRLESPLRGTPWFNPVGRLVISRS